MPVFSKCYCQFLGNDSVLLELKMSQDVLNNCIIPEDLLKIRTWIIGKSLNKLQTDKVTKRSVKTVNCELI